MTLDMVLVLMVLVGAIVLFALDRFPADLVAMLVMVSLLIAGVVTPQEALAGFSNPATVTVGAMFMLSAALFRSGALNFVGRLLLSVGRRSEWVALLVVMMGIGTISAFVNNTAAVAIFLPVVIGFARMVKVSPSKLLMPLSFASMFGGVCTVIGTSTNLLVSSIAEQHGQPPIGMFEMSSLGLIFFAAGVVYMLAVGVRLIPERRLETDLTEQYRMGEYLVDIILGETAASVGTRLAESPIVKELDIEVLDLIRNGVRTTRPSPDTVLQAGDQLRSLTSVESIAAMQERKGITLVPKAKWADAGTDRASLSLVEVAIAPFSTLEGRSMRDVQFAERFGAIVLAIRHHGRLLHDKLHDMHLGAGDALLLEMPHDRIELLQRDSNFVLVSEPALPRYRKQKIIPALLIMVGVVAAATFGVVSILVSALAGSVLMILTGCIRLEEAYNAVEWKVIFLLAGLLTLGVALEKTGAAALLSGFLVNWIGVFGPFAVLAAFYLLTSLLTEAMSNNATAVLLAPVAIATAEAMAISPRPLLMAVAFAASSSFMTPVGYQTNTLIFGPGNYKFVDFMRVGAPLNLIFWILATLLIPVFWPF
ncbi:MAG: SLC13 family permease [Gemmatimonadaceae bacterium]|nr:SLC13 family permease [Gemmatimonadaceae bacterium]